MNILNKVKGLFGNNKEKETVKSKEKTPTKINLMSCGD